ncbi:MAG: hypothetical protein FWD61_13930 [Phycisphaerales bacterium]|nr:hypothetical protein [Phycisphaerales bacterium]
MNQETTIPLPMPVPMLGAPSDPDLVTTPAPMRLLPPSQGPCCYQCGGATIRNGTCFVCTGCGATSGCS